MYVQSNENEYENNTENHTNMKVKDSTITISMLYLRCTLKYLYIILERSPKGESKVRFPATTCERRVKLLEASVEVHSTGGAAEHV